MIWVEWNSDSETGTIRCCYGWDESGSYVIVEAQRLGDLEMVVGGLYWTDTNRFYRYGGGEISAPIYMGVQGPTSIAVDVAGNKMYWVDKRTDAIRRSNLDGTAVEDLLTEVATPEDIALDLVAGNDVLDRTGHRCDPAGRPRRLQRRNPRGSGKSAEHCLRCCQRQDVLDGPGSLSFLRRGNHSAGRSRR